MASPESGGPAVRFIVSCAALVACNALLGNEQPEKLAKGSGGQGGKATTGQGGTAGRGGDPQTEGGASEGGSSADSSGGMSNAGEAGRGPSDAGGTAQVLFESEFAKLDGWVAFQKTQFDADGGWKAGSTNRPTPDAVCPQPALDPWQVVSGLLQYSTYCYLTGTRFPDQATQDRLVSPEFSGSDADFKATLSFKTSDNDVVGLVFRHADENNWAFFTTLWDASWSSGEPGLRHALVSVKDGQFETLGRSISSVGYDCAPDCSACQPSGSAGAAGAEAIYPGCTEAWQTLDVELSAGTLRAFVNGLLALEVTDAAGRIPARGSVGILTSSMNNGTPPLRVQSLRVLGGVK
ncbi:MAG TPA: hypothetical protein VFQ61_09970 [Polyangiaceae bacterium]|nr:hypothetical protein [Polyangiaceae bacterium]